MAAESDEAPVARAVLMLLAVFALYVLSIGPVWRLTFYGTTAPNWVLTAYRPLTWSAGQYTPVNKALTWYVHLWTGNRYRLLF